MTGKTRELLDEAVRRIAEAAQPEKIILFGSRARGDAGEGSDFDLLVVEREPFGPGRGRYAELARLERALGRLPAAVDILVYSREEVEELQDSLNHVVGQALREGQVVYGG